MGSRRIERHTHCVFLIFNPSCDLRCQTIILSQREAQGLSEIKQAGVTSSGVISIRAARAELGTGLPTVWSVRCLCVT